MEYLIMSASYDHPGKATYWEPYFKEQTESTSVLTIRKFWPNSLINTMHEIAMYIYLYKVKADLSKATIK